MRYEYASELIAFFQEIDERIVVSITSDEIGTREFSFEEIEERLDSYIYIDISLDITIWEDESFFEYDGISYFSEKFIEVLVFWYISEKYLHLYNFEFSLHIDKEKFPINLPPYILSGFMYVLGINIDDFHIFDLFYEDIFEGLFEHYFLLSHILSTPPLLSKENPSLFALCKQLC
jgi:hypothetical protein